MKYKKLVIYVLLFSILLLITRANTLKDDLQHHWNLSSAEATYGSVGFIAGGSPSYAAALIDNGLDCDTGDRLVNDTLSVPLPDWTMNIWFLRQSSPASYIGIMSRVSSGTYPHPFELRWNDDTSDTIEYNVGDGSSLYTAGHVVTAIDNNWHMWTLTKDNNRYIIYKDGTVLKNSTDSQTVTDDVNREFSLCRWQGGAAVDTDGILDELSIWNRTLDYDDVQDLYNSSAGLHFSNFNGSSPPAASPSLTLNTDMNNSINFNSAILYVNFNGTFTNENTDVCNCSFFVDDAEEEYKADLNLSLNQQFNYSFGDVQREFNFSVNCSNYEVNDDTGKYYYRVDTVTPMITPTLINGTQFYTDDELTLTVDFEDPNLYAYNISIFDEDGDLWRKNNTFAEGLLGGNHTNISSRILVDEGNFSVRYEAWDSHTGHVISDYPWSKFSENGYKGIEFANRRFIMETKNFTYVDGWSLVKTHDRYYLDINLSQADIWFSIFIDSDKKQIYYLNGSKYQGHFIIGKKHWIDFVSDPSRVNQLEVIPHGNNRYEVKFFADKKRFRFESIGDLNYEVTTRTYEVIEEPDEVAAAINNLVDIIDEGLSVFVYFTIVLLYIVFMVLGYHMIRTGSLFTGWSMFGISIGIDFLIAAMSIEYLRRYVTIGLVGQLVDLFFVWLFVWIVAKVIGFIGLQIRLRQYGKL